jgi:hypothetical protein
MILGLTFGLAGLAQAADQPSPSFEGAMATLHWTQPLQAPTPDPAAPSQAKPQAPAEIASDATLDSASGRGTTNVGAALTEQSLSAINTGNTVKGDTVSSGAISLQDSALSGFAGIGNILMNTGHNNNLESNMSVTVIVTP